MEQLNNLLDIDFLQSNHHLRLVLMLTVGFTLACLLGYFALKCKLSPILGYLLAGYLIGPFSPGFVADMQLSEQLAEIGVILMMFSVGLNFKIKDLIKVKRIAIPGALFQTAVSSVCSVGIVVLLGWSIPVGIIIGLAIGVASTVVLVRMLEDHGLLRTREGHMAVGWLIVEDLITVGILILLPILASIMENASFSTTDFLISLGSILFKLALLFTLLWTFGHKVVLFILSKVVRIKSHELFTLAVLSLTFILATGSTLFFGISIALGAFIAGIVIGQTRLRHQALVHSLPMKNAFIAIFFLSVGMLFNPGVIIKSFPIFISILAIILLLKPLSAYIIVILLKYPVKTAFIIAAALAQIGEFSFILSEEALKYNLMTEEGYDIIVACALVSIALNPFFFKILKLKSGVTYS